MSLSSFNDVSNTSPAILDTLDDDWVGARQATIGHRVFRAIKHAIVRGQLVPGHPVSEAELARQLGVSRQPVREAFIKLSEMGLVEIRPQRGTFVQLISRREVENARFIREAIEVAVVRRAAEVATAETAAPLFSLVEEQVTHGDHPDQSRFLQLDDALHQQDSELCVRMGQVCLVHRRSWGGRVQDLNVPIRPLRTRPFLSTPHRRGPAIDHT